MSQRKNEGEQADERQEAGNFLKRTNPPQSTRCRLAKDPASIRMNYPKNDYETAIFDKRIPCITAQTILKQLISVVKVSI